MRKLSCCFRYLLLAALLCTPACSHTSFQYRPGAKERGQLVAAVDLLRQQTKVGNPRALASTIDPEGRKALLIFAIARLADKSDKVKEALRAAFMVGLLFVMEKAFIGTDVFDEHLEASAAHLKRTLEGEFAKRYMRSSGEGAMGSAQRLMARAGSEGQGKQGQQGQLKEDLASLQWHKFSGCRYDSELISYRAGLMRYKSWGRAEWSGTFKKWKNRLERLHFIRVRCPQETALFVMAQYSDRPEPWVLLWKFFTPAQWVKVERKLNKSFGLDAS